MADNLARIRDQLGTNTVKLVAVTKTADLDQIEQAASCGVTEFGENKVQEAIKKRAQLPQSVLSNANWHFIGHLQTNKVKDAVGSFSLIHSVDSLRLAQEISRVASKKEVIQPILLQVKIEPDPNKSGFTSEQLKNEFKTIVELPAVRVDGLMTITPFIDDEATWRKCFDGLRKLRDELVREYGVRLDELSMGMSADWRIAVDCGSTMIRLGRAVFEH